VSEDKRLYYERRWLNTKHGRAFSIASIESWVKHSAEVFLEIGDCSEAISLDFCFASDDEQDFKKQLKKLDKLIDTCKKLRAAMVATKKELNKDD
jgi:hypothetical protein